MNEQPHTLVVVFDHDTLWLKVECPHTTDDRPCASYTEGTWPDEVTCRCDDPDCGCRDGDHGGCADFGRIENVGPGCRAKPTGDCWYVDMANELGVEAFSLGHHEVRVPVILRGYSCEEPIEVDYPDKDES